MRLKGLFLALGLGLASVSSYALLEYDELFGDGWDDDVISHTDLKVSEDYFRDTITGIYEQGKVDSELKLNIKNWFKDRDRVCGDDIECQYYWNFKKADELRKLTDLPLGGRVIHAIHTQTQAT